ncbi:hypothetical protein Ancab_010847 [Ancistrocladus abbreviatus]
MPTENKKNLKRKSSDTQRKSSNFGNEAWSRQERDEIRAEVDAKFDAGMTASKNKKRERVVKNSVHAADGLPDSSHKDADGALALDKKSCTKSGLLNNVFSQTIDEFETWVRSSPNSSFLWIKYMSFMLSLADGEGARAIAERPIVCLECHLLLPFICICPDYHTRRLMLHAADWEVRFDLALNCSDELSELMVAISQCSPFYGFGTCADFAQIPLITTQGFANHKHQEAVMRMFQRALQYSDPLKVHLELLGLYERTEQHELADDLIEKMGKKFKHSSKEIRLGDIDKIRSLFDRATSLSLPAKKRKFPYPAFTYGGIRSLKNQEVLVALANLLLVKDPKMSVGSRSQGHLSKNVSCLRNFGRQDIGETFMHNFSPSSRNPGEIAWKSDAVLLAYPSSAYWATCISGIQPKDKDSTSKVVKGPMKVLPPWMIKLGTVFTKEQRGEDECLIAYYAALQQMQWE